MVCISASIWGVTFQKAREVYRAVVTPMLTFAASIWYTPKNLKGASEKHVDKLAVIQNNCLRTVLGAYRATPVQVLEAEADVSSIKIQLDKALLGSKALRGTHPLVHEGNGRIRRKLQPKRDRRITPPPPPSQEKEAWAARYLDVGPQRLKEERRNPRVLKKKIHGWWKVRARGRWKSYQRGLNRNIQPVQKGEVGRERLDLFRGLKKAESSAAV